MHRFRRKTFILIFFKAVDGCYTNPKDCRCANQYGADYRSTLSNIGTGNICYKWNKQTPHLHSYSHDNYPISGLLENYFHNPNNDSNGPWCFTMEEYTRME